MKYNLKSIMAAGVTAVACLLLVAGFTVNPQGEIHQSILIAFGECLTFATAALGIKAKEGEDGPKH